MGAEEAVEAPRFQTRHLVSSFDNHAMNPGDLLLDERIPAAVGEELAERKHHVGLRSRWASGAAPVLIELMPNGRDGSRRGSLRTTASHAPGEVGLDTLFDDPAASIAMCLRRGCAALAARRHLHRRQFLEVRRLARADLLARAIIFRAAGFRGGCSKRLPARIRANLSYGLRRFRFLPVSGRRNSGTKLFAHAAGRLSVRLQGSRNRSPAKCSRRTPRYGPQAGKENDSVSGCRTAGRDVPAAARAVS